MLPTLSWFIHFSFNLFPNNKEVKEPDEAAEENQTTDDKVTLTLPCSESHTAPAAEAETYPPDESPCESKELIQENGLSEAQKERARSRGMSLLMEAQTPKRVTDEPKTGKLFAFLQF